MKINKKVMQIKFLASVITVVVLLINFNTAGAHFKSKNSSPAFNGTAFVSPVPLAFASIQKWPAPYKPLITTTYTFDCSSDHSGYTYFNVSVNEVSISGTEAITTGSPVDVYNTNPVSQGSTVVVQITGGYMPTSSVLEGPFPVIWGSISGSTITYTNVPLNNGYDVCGLLLN